MGYAALTIKTATVASNTSAVMQGIQIEQHGSGVLSPIILFSGLVDTSSFDYTQFGWLEISGDTFIGGVRIGSTPGGFDYYSNFNPCPIGTNLFLTNQLYDYAVDPDGFGVCYLSVYLLSATAASHIRGATFRGYKHF
jgi:hypothetical protein